MSKRLVIPSLLLLLLLAALTSLVSAQTATPPPIPTITPIGFVVTAGPTTFYVTTLTPIPTPGCAARKRASGLATVPETSTLMGP